MSSHSTSTWRRPVQASDCESHTTLVITLTLAVGARLGSTPEAGSRACARDERVAEGDE